LIPLWLGRLRRGKRRMMLLSRRDRLRLRRREEREQVYYQEELCLNSILPYLKTTKAQQVQMTTRKRRKSS
jgi:hypothetical protein